MKALHIFVSFVSLVASLPQQRGGSCQCRDVICPNNGRDACDCLNRAAEDCFRSWRNPACPSPTPLNCNGGGRPPTQNSQGWKPGVTSFSTVFSVVPYRTTLTTTLPGFGWPNPVTSYSYSMSTTTITVVHSSPRGSPPRTTPSYPRTTNTPWRPDPPPPTTTYPPWPVADNPPGTPPPEITPPEIPPPEIPPPEITPEPPTQTTPKPPPWTPPATSHGPVWTPIANPNLPQPSPDQPAPLPTPSTQPAPVVPVPEGPAPIKCGPDVPEPCRGNTYCDPQPLCSIGEDCPGVCLPIVQLGFSNQRFTQSWDARREIWQKMLDDGLYVMYRYSI